MNIIDNPSVDNWDALIKRPYLQQNHLEDRVSSIIEDVQLNGDEALYKYTALFDDIELSNISVSISEIQNAHYNISPSLKSAISLAKENIECFHKSQIQDIQIIETKPGVKCWRKQVPIDRVGLYIPGGTAPLFSTLLMLGIPAKLAGCKEIILCTPPNKNGSIHPVILYTAAMLGITHVKKIGGAQAIAAMAHGTESVCQVDKIFGPGNQYVTMAKELVQKSGISIDLPAGPSEVLIIADQTANPQYVAADLLSQAEHGIDSQVILLSDSAKILTRCIQALNEQIIQLPRQEIVQQAINNSKAILFSDIESCMQFSNYYAPEHLLLTTKNGDELAQKVINAGSVFIGEYSCESAGDYASGTNHTLPTNGYARSYSGTSLDSFVKNITFQKLSAQGIKNIGPAIEIMAEAEGLFAHKNAVTLRLKDLKNV